MRIVPSFVAPPSTQNNGIPFAFDSNFMTVIGEVDGVTIILPISVQQSQFGLGEISMQGGITTMLLIRTDEVGLVGDVIIAPP